MSVRAVRAVLLDLGGVAFVGDRPLPGAARAIARLRTAGLTLRFLTNTTRRPARTLLADLAAMGLDIAPEELLTPAALARDHLAAHGLTPHLLVHEALEGEFADSPRAGPPAVVVGDAAERFDYARLNAAFRLLEQGAAFLALARNRSFRDSDDRLSLDAGAFVAALEYATGREATTLGKPSPDFFARALDSAGAAPDNAVMVGDDAEADVGGAQASGIPAVLVRTGKYKAGDERRIDPPPAHLADDLAAAADWILSRSTP